METLNPDDFVNVEPAAGTGRIYDNLRQQAKNVSNFYDKWQTALLKDVEKLNTLMIQECIPLIIDAINNCILASLIQVKDEGDISIEILEGVQSDVFYYTKLLNILIDIRDIRLAIEKCENNIELTKNRILI
jgi:hypothetical protein